MKHRLSNDELETLLHEEDLEDQFNLPQRQILAERRQFKVIKKQLSNKPEKVWEPKQKEKSRFS